MPTTTRHLPSEHYDPAHSKEFRNALNLVLNAHAKWMTSGGAEGHRLDLSSLIADGAAVYMWEDDEDPAPIIHIVETLRDRVKHHGPLPGYEEAWFLVCGDTVSHARMPIIRFVNCDFSNCTFVGCEGLPTGSAGRSE